MPPRPSDLARFRDGLTSTYGKRAAPSRPKPAPYQVLSTGILGLDYALRLGGLVRGRVHEIVGAPDSAKTTAVICAMAQAQRDHPRFGIGYVDMEGTFDDAWAAANGLDLSAFDHLYADDSEDASDMARNFARTGFYSLVVVDSIGAMESRKALAKDAVDELPGRNAQVITRMCKHLGSLTRQTGCTVILVNQLRAQLGTMGADVSAGPKAMQHATTTRIAMSGGSQEPMKIVFEPGQPGEIVARQFKARVTRSKAFPPGRVAEFWVNNRTTDEYGPAGINAVDEYIMIGVRLGVIERDGAGNYAIPGAERKVKGRDAAIRLLRERPDLCETVRKSVFSQGGQPT